MPKVLLENDGRIGRITLNRPEVMNAIDDDLPRELAAAVMEADANRDIHVILLSGAGSAFCAGYDLAHYAEGSGSNQAVQDMPWDPMQDYAFMWSNTQAFMSLFRAMKPVLCKVHGFAVAGGSDIALCADLTIMADNAQIGYMPSRVWGCPTTAMWVHRVGPEKAKRMMFTNSAVEDEINRTQRLATIFDGMSRHSPEGLNFKDRVEQFGWKQAVQERDNGTFDWTRRQSFSE